MELDLFMYTCIALVATAMIVCGGVCGGAIHAYFVLRREDLIDKRNAEKASAQARAEKALSDRKESNLKYSTDVLEFVHGMIVHITAIHYNNFVDSHEITKVTKGQIERLIDEVAKAVHASIDVKNIDFARTLFDSNYYETYIVETVVELVKQLTEKSVNKYIEG